MSDRTGGERQTSDVRRSDASAFRNPRFRTDSVGDYSSLNAITMPIHSGSELTSVAVAM
jgi:hypothetical protein